MWSLVCDMPRRRVTWDTDRYSDIQTGRNRQSVLHALLRLDGTVAQPQRPNECRLKHKHFRFCKSKLIKFSALDSIVLRVGVHGPSTQTAPRAVHTAQEAHDHRTASRDTARGVADGRRILDSNGRGDRARTNIGAGVDCTGRRCWMCHGAACGEVAIGRPPTPLCVRDCEHCSSSELLALGGRCACFISQWGYERDCHVLVCPHHDIDAHQRVLPFMDAGESVVSYEGGLSGQKLDHPPRPRVSGTTAPMANVASVLDRCAGWGFCSLGIGINLRGGVRGTPDTTHRARIVVLWTGHCGRRGRVGGVPTRARTARGS